MLSAETSEKIIEVLTSAFSRKINSYVPESNYKPFMHSFFDTGQLITHSIVHAFYTVMGMSAYEQIAVLLAEEAGYTAKHQFKLQGKIDDSTSLLITRICATKSEGKEKELEAIRASIRQDVAEEHLEGTVDVFVKRPDGTEIYVDITTVKPNLKEFRALRGKMLRWAALRYSQKPEANVQTCIGIPYNPYYPKPYDRWTGSGSDPKEILIQEDLWATFAGYDVYADLIQLFEQAGQQVREDVSNFLKNQS